MNLYMNEMGEFVDRYEPRKRLKLKHTDKEDGKRAKTREKDEKEKRK